MEENYNKITFVFLLLTISFTLSSTTTITHFQTLTINSLPNPSTLSWPEESESLSDDSEPLSLQLHHIDSLSSNKTPQHLFHLRLQRDAARVKSFTLATSPNQSHPLRSTPGFRSSIVSGLSQGSGEYFTRIGVGTPAKFVFMVLDTGSDVVWLQCAPCRKCYTQADPVFDPTKSLTFAGIPCGAPLCRRLDSAGCNNRNKVCQYQVSYGDGSFTFGDFSTETKFADLLLSSLPATTTHFLINTSIHKEEEPKIKQET